MDEIIFIAIRAAIGAGAEILKVYGTGFDIELKDDHTPLTVADKRAHHFIVNTLAETGLNVLSEEGSSIEYNNRKDWEQFWMVDPLDGTKEFIKRNGDFTVNIALISKQQSVYGIIYVPVTDVLYFGGANYGAYKLERAAAQTKSISTLNECIEIAETLPIQNPGRAYTIVASRSHLSPETSAFIGSKKEQYGDLQFLSRGSSLKICLVAEGLADCYPRLAPTMEWDTAAGQAIAEGAGCNVTLWPSGEVMRYNKENLLNSFFVVSST